MAWNTSDRRSELPRPISAELQPTVEQAAEWLREIPVHREVRCVTQLIARLRGNDSQVVTAFRSIADAAQLRHGASEYAIYELNYPGWLSIQPARQGTLFQLCVGITGRGW